MFGSLPFRLTFATATFLTLIHVGCRTVVPAPVTAPDPSASAATPAPDASSSAALVDTAAPATSASGSTAAPSASASAPPAVDPKLDEEKYVTSLSSSVSRVACASRRGATLTMTLTVKNGVIEAAKALEPIVGSTSGQSRVLPLPALKGQAVPALPSTLPTLFDTPYTFTLAC